MGIFSCWGKESRKNKETEQVTIREVLETTWEKKGTSRSQKTVKKARKNSRRSTRERRARREASGASRRVGSRTHSQVQAVLGVHSQGSTRVGTQSRAGSLRQQKVREAE